MDNNETLRTIAEELRNFARHAYGKPVVVPVTPDQLNRLAQRLEEIANEPSLEELRAKIEQTRG